MASSNSMYLFSFTYIFSLSLFVPLTSQSFNLIYKNTWGQNLQETEYKELHSSGFYF